MIIINLVAFCLTILGGINWLSIGILQFDFVAGIFGTQSAIMSRIVYVIIGLAACYLIYAAIKGRTKLDLMDKKRITDKTM